jgi:hypothetical protein
MKKFDAHRIGTFIVMVGRRPFMQQLLLSHLQAGHHNVRD